jgi:lipopolysaccharide export system permease protein
MSRLTRYILVQSLGTMLFVTMVLSAAIWLAQSLRLIDLIVNRGLSLSVFLYLALLILPRFLDIVLPIGIFIAVLFTYSKLTAESEIVVMRAAGIGPAGLARPAALLAVIGTLALFLLSAWLLPASNRAFKDLQFEIRNQFVAAVLQEGTFTTLSDRLTVYIRGREPNGELTGLLIQDERDKEKPVTIVAERGTFVETGNGTRMVMLNGNRQQFNRVTGKLSLLSFEKYTLDLDDLRDTPVSRTREPQEKYLHELWLEPAPDNSYRVERHQRILQPLSVPAFVVIPLVCILTGEFNRRGQTRRVLLAVALAFAFQALDVGLKNAASRIPAVIPAMYVNVLGPVVLGTWLLLRDQLGTAFRRPAMAAR